MKEIDEEDKVWYCKGCLSLRILELDEETLYCDDCGCADIGEATIDEWDTMYQKKYNVKFLNKKKLWKKK
jgi:hypothetical protein